MAQTPHRIISQTMIDSHLYRSTNQAIDLYESLCELRKSNTTSDVFNTENQPLLSQQFISKIRNTILTLQSIQADVEVRFFVHDDLNKLAQLANERNQNSIDYLALEHHDDELDASLKTIKTAGTRLNKLQETSVPTSKGRQNNSPYKF